MVGCVPDHSGETTILYIDDDEAFGVLSRKNLGRQGFAVVSVFDGHSALVRLAAGGIDAIALDHYLVGETGLDILPQIVGQADHPPVIYVTGSGEAGIAEEALKHGADGCVIKNASPDFFEFLGLALRQVLERARFDRETGSVQKNVR